MDSSSILEPPFRLSASEIASLWSEETGRSAIEIREDLETWLEAFGREDNLSRDEQLWSFLGVRRVDRASLLTYCRNRGLEFPEFWFSDTIAREKSTGWCSDGPEPDHIAFSGSGMGSGRSIEPSPTSASESLAPAVREDLMPRGEDTDEYVSPRPVAVQLEPNRIAKARLVSRRLFTWWPALIVAFGVTVVGWRYWSVDVEYRVIASENVQKTALLRIEKGLETQTSNEMVREDQYRTDRAFLESQSRAGTEAATVKSLSSEMTQDELSIAPGKDWPAALDAQTPQADWQVEEDTRLVQAKETWMASNEERLHAIKANWQGEEDQRRTVAESTWKMEEEQRLTTLRATWESEEKQRLNDAQRTWQTAQEQNLEEDRMASADEEKRRLAEAEEAWKATNKKHIAAAEKMWRSDEAQRLAKAQEAWAAEEQTRLAKAEVVWKEAAEARLGKNRVTQAGALEGLAEAEAAWQAKSAESLAAAEAAWKRDEEARFAAARKTWAEEAKKLAGAAAGASVEAQLAAAQATWEVEEEFHLAAARNSWKTGAKQRQATDREAQTASSGEDRLEVWTGETSLTISILTPKDRQSGWKKSQVRKPYASEREGLGEISLEKAALPFSAASSPTAEEVAAKATLVTAALGEGEDIETAVFVEAEIALPPADPPQEEGIPNSRPEHLGPWHDTKETDLPDDILVYLTQKQLHVRDLYSGEMTGTLTYDTRAAIQSYQISYGIVPDGEVSKELLRHLAYKNLDILKQFGVEPRHMVSAARSSSEMSTSQTNQTLGTTRGQAPDGTKGHSAKKHIFHSVPESEHGTSTRRDMIRRTQEMLSAAGFQAGPSDGILGQQTKSAIESYQWAYDLTTDGLPTVGLLSHIEATIYLEDALRQFSLGEFREASLSFSRLLKLRPGDADIYFNRGLAFKNSGNLAKASEDFQAAIEINPAHTRAHFNLGGVHYQQGQYGAALGSYGRFVQVSLQGR